MAHPPATVAGRPYESPARASSCSVAIIAPNAPPGEARGGVLGSPESRRLTTGPPGRVTRAHASAVGGVWAFFMLRAKAARSLDGGPARVPPLPRAARLRRLDRRRCPPRRGAAPALEPHLPALIDDFYAEIERHPDARKVITGGQAQIERLKGTLLQWVRELLGGRYDEDYVARRWRVGWRHVEIGLDQVYTNVALSRLRAGLVRALGESWPGEPAGLIATVRVAQQAARPRPGHHRGRLPGRVRRPAPARPSGWRRIGQVAGGVAHELRNPLNVVKTSVYYLLNARNPTPEKTGRAPAADRAARRPGRRRDHDAVELRQDAGAAARARRASSRASARRWRPTRRRAGSRSTSAFPPDLPPALADADQLRIVFGNLIRNARDAMPEGGRLSVAGRRDGDGRRGRRRRHRRRHPAGATSPGSWSRSTRPRPAGWAWGWPSSRTILDKKRGRLRVDERAGPGQHVHGRAHGGRRRPRRDGT